MWVRSIDRSDARLIGGTSIAMYPFWSPDSRSLAYFDGAGSGSLKRVDVSGGLPVVVADIGSYGRGGSWSEDGRILFATANGTIWSVRAEGGAPSGVTTLDTERSESAHYWPQFVGDGRFLYFIRNSRKELEGIYLGTIGEDGKESSRRFVVASSSSGTFVPDEQGTRAGHLLWVQNGRLLARPFDLASGELSGEVRELGVTVDVVESQRGALFSVAENGALVASSPPHGRVQIVSLGRDGTGLQMHHEVGEGAMTHRLHVSPDGRWIAFGVNKEGDADLWIHDLQTSVTSPLTFGPSHDEFAVWSPDSSAVVFRSSSPGKQYLGRANLSTREVAHSDLGSIDFVFIPYAFLDDGRVVGSKFGPVRGIAASTVEGSAELVTLVDGEIVESVSPDRNWLLTRSSTSDGLLVPRRVNVTAGKLALGPPGARFPLDRPNEAIWTSGGDEVIARRNRRIFSVPVNRSNDSISFGPPVELHKAPPMRTGITPSPDGSRIYLVINPADESHTFTVVGDWRSRL